MNHFHRTLNKMGVEFGTKEIRFRYPAYAIHNCVLVIAFIVCYLVATS